jgi:5-methylcytosine-specific restriction enzyme subunit McrC
VKTETLTESKTANITMTPAQAAAVNHLGRRLAGQKEWWGQSSQPDGDPSVITCKHRGGNRYDVRVADAVGVVAVRDLQLIVQPKIPTRHLIYLLQAAGGLPRTLDSATEAAADTTLWHLVARWFVTALEALLRRDLISDYREATDELTLVRGRILLAPTARSFYAGRLRPTCQFDEYDTDNPLNRLLKAAAQLVAASPSLGKQLRKRAARTLAILELVGAIQPADIYATPDRRTQGYAPAVTLAKAVLGRRGYTIASGQSSAWTFLFRTPELVEAGVREILKEALSPICPVTKRGIALKPSKMTLNPDLVFGDPVAVGDVKYKLVGSDWRRDHLYQSTAFAVGFRVLSAAVVGFAVQPLDLPPPVNVGDVSVAAFAWRANADVEPEAAAKELGDMLRAWLTPLVTVTSG